MRSPIDRRQKPSRLGIPNIPQRTGFTLVELLVVIVIIGILTALISVVAARAMRAAKQAVVKVEVDGLTAGFKAYKEKYGEYPPNFNDPDAVARHLRKVFPRIDPIEAEALYNAAKTTEAQYRPSAAQAVYFWLGGFSSDPQRPITGPGGPGYVSALSSEPVYDFSRRHGVFDFDQSRLGPIDPATGTFLVDNTTRKKIPAFKYGAGKALFLPLPVYMPKGTDEKRAEPYVYFDTSRVKPDSTTTPLPPIYTSAVAPARGKVAAFVRNGASGLEFVNPDSFQVLSAGLDDFWSPETVPTLGPFPNGPYAAEMADNLTNFTTGSLEDAQP